MIPLVLAAVLLGSGAVLLFRPWRHPRWHHPTAFGTAACIIVSNFLLLSFSCFELQYHEVENNGISKFYMV
jgi:hypothetical protein